MERKLEKQAKKRPTIEEVKKHNLKEKMKAREPKIIILLENYCHAMISKRFHLARFNMMADQIKSGKIVENVDGKVKSLQYMTAEAAVEKGNAIKWSRKAFFLRKKLVDDFKCPEKRVDDALADYYEGTIDREDWGECVETISKSEFI